jgi:DNA-binding IclR family transcriptional regulator
MSALQLGTLEKAQKILDLYYRDAESLTFTEIVHRTGLEKGSVQRLLFSLQALGFLTKNERHKLYSLSPRFISFAVSFLQTDPLIGKAIKVLEPLARHTQESVGLALLDGVNVYYVTRVPNLVSHDFALLPVRRPAYCTAAGRAIMSRLHKADVDRILRESDLRKMTSKTIINPAQIRRRVAAARRNGLAWQDAEILEKELAIAAPITNEAGESVAAVTISMDKSRFTLGEAIAHFSPMVKAAAQDISSPHREAPKRNAPLPERRSRTRQG